MTLAWGWGIVCTRDGQAYWNNDDYHVPENIMVKAATEFMAGGREAQVLHNGKRAGTVVHCFPLTSDIAKAMNIVTNQTGLLVGVQFDDPAILAKFERGELVGFSPAWTGYAVPMGDFEKWTA